MDRFFFLTIALYTMFCGLSAQTLDREMSADSIRESMATNLEQDMAYLHVRSQVPELKFESNRKIGRVVSLSSGDWELWLPPGTHVLKIAAVGYKRLELTPFIFGKKRSYELVINAAGTESMKRADQQLIEITFHLSEDSVSATYGNFAPITSLDRSVTFRVPKGDHTFRFQKRGFEDEIHQITVTEPEQINVLLKQGISDLPSKLPLPGFIRVESDPTGADVLINSQPIGKTNYQGSISAGTYQVELTKSLYYAEFTTITVEQGKTKSVRRQLKPHFALLSVIGSVSGSSTFVDDSLIGQATVMKKQIESGHHGIRVEAQLYHPYSEEIELKDGEDRTVSVLLAPAFGSLEIESTPEVGASVYLDGQVVGTTPFSNSQIASGQHHLRVSKELFGDVELPVFVTDRAVTKRNVELTKKFGNVKIIAPNSDIILNGKQVGNGLYVGRLSPGLYSVIAQRTGPYKPARKDIMIGIGDDQVVDLQPEGRIGGLTILVEPYEAGDAELLINGESIGTSTRAVRQLIGDYTISAIKTGFINAHQQIAIEEDKNKELVIQMIRYEGSRQATADKWRRVKWVGAISGILSGGAATYFKISANDAHYKYNSATTSDAAASYKGKTQTNDRLFAVTAIIAGVCAATAIVSWIAEGGN